MTYDEFMMYVTDHIKEYLPDRYADHNVSITKQLKNNDVVLDGLIIKKDETMLPTLYLNEPYKKFQSGMDLGKIMLDLADTYVAHQVQPEMETDVMSCINDYDTARNHIRMRVCNARENIDRLAGCPHTIVEDLAVTYHIALLEKNDSIASCLITNELQKHYGVTKSEIHEDAVTNMNREEFSFLPMVDKLREMMYPALLENFDGDRELAQMAMESVLPGMHEGSFPLWILSNPSMINGASCIMSGEIREKVAEKVGGDYYVIPSSIHEVLIMQKGYDMSVEEIRQMVIEVNETQVQPEERLSDNVYEYDVKKKEFTLCRGEVMDKELEEEQQERKKQRIQEQEKDKEKKKML